MRDTLSAKQPVAVVSILGVHRQHYLMAVSAQTEPRAGWPIIPHRPQAGNVVARVKLICCVNKEDSLFPRIVPFRKEGMGSVDCALNPRLKVGVELRITTCVICLGVIYFQNAFYE